MKNFSAYRYNRNQGQAALVTVVFFLFISLALTGAFANTAVQESKISRVNLDAKQSYDLAEAGVEDATWRILKGKNYTSPIVLTLNGFSATTTVTNVGINSKTITARGYVSGGSRSISTSLTPGGTSVSFHYGVQVDDGGITMGNGSSIIGNIYSNGSITGSGSVTGDVVVAGSANKIGAITIGNSSSGTGRANAFNGTTIHGSSCPNQYCIVDNPAHQNLPISDAVIQGWRNEAAAGGTVANQNISGSVSIGPKKINGDLNLNNGGILTVTGTLWVTGNFNASNNTTVKLSSSYGTNSGVIVVDNTVDASNNTTLSGSGQAGSYLMVVGAKNAPASEVMDISNNSLGAIYYANHGRIHFNNNATAKEVTGYGLDFDNNASVTYESGLANANFTSGPGAGWQISNWQEVQ